MKVYVKKWNECEGERTEMSEYETSECEKKEVESDYQHVIENELKFCEEIIDVTVTVL